MSSGPQINVDGGQASREWDVTLGSSRVVFGENALDRLGDVVAELTDGPILLVSDPGIREAGHSCRAEKVLRDRGLAVHVFDRVAENPTTKHVDDGVAFARPLNVNGIVAVGGGSAMDCAKGINFVLTNGGRMVDYWGYGKARLPMLPSVGVPTTAGTGSEAQSYALISQTDTHIKMACGDPKVKFRAALLDPALLQSAPAPVVAATGMDAVSHALESYVTRRRNPFSMLFASEAWRLLETSFDRVLNGATDLATWGDLLLGAHYSGMAIEHSMLGAAHACANPLTARHGVIHGCAVGLMLPHVIRFNAQGAQGIGGLYAELHGVDDAEQLVQRVMDLQRAAQLPQRLGECGVQENDLTGLAGEAAEQWTAKFNPVQVSERELLSIYETAY